MRNYLKPTIYLLLFVIFSVKKGEHRAFRSEYLSKNLRTPSFSQMKMDLARFVPTGRRQRALIWLLALVVLGGSVLYWRGGHSPRPPREDSIKSNKVLKALPRREPQPLSPLTTDEPVDELQLDLFTKNASPEEVLLLVERNGADKNFSTQRVHRLLEKILTNAYDWLDTDFDHLQAIYKILVVSPKNRQRFNETFRTYSMLNYLFSFEKKLVQNFYRAYLRVTREGFAERKSQEKFLQTISFLRTYGLLKYNPSGCKNCKLPEFSIERCTCVDKLLLRLVVELDAPDSVLHRYLAGFKLLISRQASNQVLMKLISHKKDLSALYHLAHFGEQVWGKQKAEIDAYVLNNLDRCLAILQLKDTEKVEEHARGIAHWICLMAPFWTSNACTPDRFLELLKGLVQLPETNEALFLNCFDLARKNKLLQNKLTDRSLFQWFLSKNYSQAAHRYWKWYQKAVSGADFLDKNYLMKNQQYVWSAVDAWALDLLKNKGIDIDKLNDTHYRELLTNRLDQACAYLVGARLKSKHPLKIKVYLPLAVKHNLPQTIKQFLTLFKAQDLMASVAQDNLIKELFFVGLARPSWKAIYMLWKKKIKQPFRLWGERDPYQVSTLSAGSHTINWSWINGADRVYQRRFVFPDRHENSLHWEMIRDWCTQNPFADYKIWYDPETTTLYSYYQTLLFLKGSGLDRQVTLHKIPWEETHLPIIKEAYGLLKSGENTLYPTPPEKAPLFLHYVNWLKGSKPYLRSDLYRLVFTDYLLSKGDADLVLYVDLDVYGMRHSKENEAFNGWQYFLKEGTPEGQYFKQYIQEIQEKKEVQVSSNPQVKQTGYLFSDENIKQVTRLGAAFVKDSGSLLGCENGVHLFWKGNGPLMSPAVQALRAYLIMLHYHALKVFAAQGKSSSLNEKESPVSHVKTTYVYDSLEVFLFLIHYIEDFKMVDQPTGLGYNGGGANKKLENILLSIRDKNIITKYNQSQKKYLKRLIVNKNYPTDYSEEMPTLSDFRFGAPTKGGSYNYVV